MKFQKAVFIFTSGLFLTTVHAAEPSALQSTNLANPNISVIGWFQAEAGHRQPQTEDDEAFGLKEAELSFQSMVDTYARADFFISVHDDEIEVEEGYINWFDLPYNLALKLGKFRANFGKFNRTHTAETAFADRPLGPNAYFGEEGLSGTGASLSWHVPIDAFLMNVDLEAFNTPEAEDAPAFEKARKGDLTYVGRVSGYIDMTESLNLTTGGSYAYGAAGQEYDAIANSSTTLNNQMVGFDATFRWKNPRRAIYRSAFWQTEVFTNRREITSSMHENSYGVFSHLEYQFARRWRTGGRYDYTQTPLDHTIAEKGGLIYLTFTPSEFSLISLQGRHVNFSDGTDENLGFLKVTFNIGPHGSHPF